MELEIKKETENKSLGRKEVEFAGEGSGKTPSRKELLEKLSGRLVAKQELIVIKRIDNPYGSHRFLGTAHVYASKEILGRIEPGYLLKRGIAEEKKGEKAAAPAPAKAGPAKA